MGNSVLVDTRDMKQIVGANSAIALSVINLLDLADRMPAGTEAEALRIELRKVLDQAEKIQTSVNAVIRDNK